MNRPYMLISQIPGVPDRLVSSVTRDGALAIAARSTWTARPVDLATIPALERAGFVLEAPTSAQGDLLATEGGEA